MQLYILKRLYSKNKTSLSTAVDDIIKSQNNSIHNPQKKVLVLNIHSQTDETDLSGKLYI